VPHAHLRVVPRDLIIRDGCHLVLVADSGAGRDLGEAG
jgi:hypothetical protein